MACQSGRMRKPRGFHVDSYHAGVKTCISGGAKDDVMRTRAVDAKGVFGRFDFMIDLPKLQPCRGKQFSLIIEWL